MKFHFTEDELPEISEDVLGFYGVGSDEFHVLYLSSDEKWYRRRDTGRAMSAPDFWVELPSPESVYEEV